MSDDIWVVDLSHWNTVKSFTSAAADGLVGVIHKATEGSGGRDDTYKSRESQARGAGLLWSSYHFMRPGNQRDHFQNYLEFAAPREGERVCLDYEDDDLSLSSLYEAMDYIQEVRPDLQMTIYSGHLLKEQLGSKNDAKLAKASLWIAQYTSAGSPSWPTGTWKSWSLWQYTDGESGGNPRSVAGIIAPTDCNRFNGTKEACIAWLGPAGAKPEPEPEPEPEVPVEVSVLKVNYEVPEGISLEITVSGEGTVTVIQPDKVEVS
jgi:lysozyme